MTTQRDLPKRQRDMAMTITERDKLEAHYGLVRAIAHYYKNARIPDLESELCLHAVRIAPSWTKEVGPYGPWLKACLSRYCLNLIRKKKNTYGKESAETDQCSGNVNDILLRIQSNEKPPDELMGDSEDLIESWGDQSTKAVPAPEPIPENHPKRIKRMLNARAMRWVSKHPHLLGAWRGIEWYAEMAQVTIPAMRRALKLKGYSQPSKKPRPQTVQPTLFAEV